MQSAPSDQVQACADSGNLYPFCSPVSSDLWLNGTTHDFVWNFNYPFYVGYDQISLYLYYIIKYEYVSVKNFTNLDRSSGGIEVTVDNSWFLSQLPPGSSPQNLTIAGFYLPSTLSPYAEISSPISMFPRPFNFTVTQFAYPANSTTNGSNNNSTSNTSNNSPNSSHTSSSNNNNNSLSSSSNSDNLPGWAIAVIVIAVIAFICGVTALIYTMIMSHRNKRNNKLIPVAGGAGGNNSNSRSFGGGGGKGKKGYAESINSQTKVTAFRSTDSVPMTTAENASSIGTSLTYNNNNGITSSEAVLLADQFRNTLGRSSVNNHSDWNEPTAATLDGMNEEEAELKRKRLGEALLQRQLEEDGTSVKHAGRFTRVKSLADIPKSVVSSASEATTSEKY